MDIQVAISACNSSILFNEPQAALEYLKMLLHLIQPSQFLQYVQATATEPHAVEQAKEMITQCMGVPS